MRDSAVRGALLTDLVFLGRLSNDADTLTIDTTPTGFDPADRLLDRITYSPERTLDWWLRRGGIGQQQLADHLVATGRWQRHRGARRYQTRYVDADGATSDRIDERRQALRQPVNPSPETAALACIAQSTGLLDRSTDRMPGELISQCATATWIVRAVLDFLDVARAHLIAASAMPRPVHGPGY